MSEYHRESSTIISSKPLETSAFEDTYVTRTGLLSAADSILARIALRKNTTQPNINQPNRKERRKIEKLNRVARARSRKVRDGGLPKTAKKYQQVDARGSTINNVEGDQINIVVNTPTSPHIEKVDQDITIPENPDIDPELNKYPPLVEFGLKVVMSTTNLVTTNITAAAAYIAEIPQILKSNIKSITVKRTSFRYSFFSDEDVQPCSSPVAACPTCFHVLQ